MKKLALFLFFILFSCSVFAQNGPEKLVIVPAESITPEKISSGYNLLTDSEKTQALIGSSTVDFSVKNLTTSGFAMLGEAATGIKMKLIASTTADAQGTLTSYIHGLDATKIVAIQPSIYFSANGASAVPPNTAFATLEYAAYWSDLSVLVQLSASNSGGLLSKPISILVWYKE